MHSKAVILLTMSEINLGNPREKGSDGPCCGSDIKDKNYPNYPTMCINDEAADRLKGAFESPLEVDDSVVLTNVKCRVSGVRHDEYGRSITLEIQSCEGGTDTGTAAETPKDDGGEADAADADEPAEKEPMAKITKKMPSDAASYA